MKCWSLKSELGKLWYYLWTLRWTRYLTVWKQNISYCVYLFSSTRSDESGECEVLGRSKKFRADCPVSVSGYRIRRTYSAHPTLPARSLGRIVCANICMYGIELENRIRGIATSSPTYKPQLHRATERTTSPSLFWWSSSGHPSG